MIALRRRWQIVGDQRGISLIELLVAVSLLTILLVIVSGLYISTLRTVDLSRGLNGNTKNVSTAMNAITRTVRAGTANPVNGATKNDPAFVVATQDNLVMYAYINLDSAAERPVMIQLQVNRANGKLIEKRWAAVGPVDGYWTFPNYLTAAPVSTRTLGEAVSPANTVLFTYVGEDGAIEEIKTANLGAEERRSIRQVKVSLSMQTNLTDAKTKVSLQNTVGMPNLGFTGGEL
jgi:prepilin-type N-terminal cleavage/methylation domain-containing protein